MTIAILALLCVLTVFWYYRRQRVYLNKDLKDVVSEGMKKELNIVSNGDSFGHKLDDKMSCGNKSQDILKNLN